MNKIGEKIKQRRKELRWSQRDLAEKMGYNHSTVTRIETGKIDIPQSRIVQFSEVLNVDISYLMGWEEEKPTVDDRLSKDMQELIGRIKNLPEEKIQLLLQIAKQIE